MPSSLCAWEAGRSRTEQAYVLTLMQNSRYATVLNERPTRHGCREPGGTDSLEKRRSDLLKSARISRSSYAHRQIGSPMLKGKWRNTSRIAQYSDGFWIQSRIAPRFTGPAKLPSESINPRSSAVIPFCPASNWISEKSSELTSCLRP